MAEDLYCPAELHLSGLEYHRDVGALAIISLMDSSHIVLITAAEQQVSRLALPPSFYRKIACWRLAGKTCPR